jgi:alkanesulfonate monooxygenase SsuD/methylene tetrahydromethanopterin reductase-like flavin-dependent oxidoreductase (luciferase family)
VASREGTRLFSASRFKIGLFAPNCMGGTAMLKDNLWDASWEHNLTAAHLAEEAGLEFVLPVGRWRGTRGYPHESEEQGGALETLTWASALLAATRDICVFGTLHVTFIHPVFAAKMVVTADLVGGGRFGLNIVSGSNTDDFALFGLPFPGHEARYEYIDEWLTIVERAWSETAPFDFSGAYFTLKGVLQKPKPYGGSRPLLVNAANSPAGRRFAANHVDVLLMSIIQLDNLGAEIATVRDNAGRNIDVFASAHLICRPTRKEADEFYHHVVYDLGDWEIVDRVAEERTRGRYTPLAALTGLKERLISGGATFPIVGSYDEVAEMFARMSAAGLNGIALSLLDYVGEFPALQEVLLRLERLGVR